MRFKRVDGKDVVGTDEFSSLDKWTLRECWEMSPYLNAIRKYINSPFEAPCSSCKNLPQCFSGCTAQKYIKHRRLKKVPDPLCLGENYDTYVN